MVVIRSCQHEVLESGEDAKNRRTHQNISCTLDDKAVSETVQPNGATLLIEVDLLFWQQMAYPTAGTQTGKRQGERRHCRKHR